jgi:hypothetical protein
LGAVVVNVFVRNDMNVLVALLMLAMMPGAGGCQTEQYTFSVDFNHLRAARARQILPDGTVREMAGRGDFITVTADSVGDVEPIIVESVLNGEVVAKGVLAPGIECISRCLALDCDSGRDDLVLEQLTITPPPIASDPNWSVCGSWCKYRDGYGSVAICEP